MQSISLSSLFPLLSPPLPLTQVESIKIVCDSVYDICLHYFSDTVLIQMQTAFHWACIGGDIKCVSLLVEAGADIQLQVNTHTLHKYIHIHTYYQLTSLDIIYT